MIKLITQFEKTGPIDIFFISLGNLIINQIIQKPEKNSVAFSNDQMLKFMMVTKKLILALFSCT